MLEVFVVIGEPLAHVWDFRCWHKGEKNKCKLNSDRTLKVAKDVVRRGKNPFTDSDFTSRAPHATGNGHVTTLAADFLVQSHQLAQKSVDKSKLNGFVKVRSCGASEKVWLTGKPPPDY
mmetsp:Transcript_13840/g.19201  ORF Transcript_13840/g.19201 Transcript_13840/m.19201 type:complete len:119 (+) Transcript_13840:158-514(+)